MGLCAESGPLVGDDDGGASSQLQQLMLMVMSLALIIANSLKISNMAEQLELKFHGELGAGGRYSLVNRNERCYHCQLIKQLLTSPPHMWQAYKCADRARERERIKLRCGAAQCYIAWLRTVVL